MKYFSLDKLLSLAFGLVVFWFFAFLYPFHLNYQEQYQMFLFSSDYFLNFFAKPGGISDYIGNFFTQFYFYSWVGALILAVLLVVLQRAVWFISKQLGAKPVFVPITFIPSLLYWSLFCDENYLLGGLIVMLIVSGFISAFLLIKPVNIRMGFVLVSIPVLFWMAGGAFVLLPLFAVAFEAVNRNLKVTYLSIFALVSAVLSYVIPTLCKSLFLQISASSGLDWRQLFPFPG